MDRRNAGVLEFPLEPEVEVGGVDADEQIRPVAQHALRQAAADAHDLAVVAQRLCIAAHRQLLHREMRFEALGHHARTADAREFDSRAPRLQRGDQVGSQQIARGFAGHHADAQMLCHRSSG